MSKVVNNWQQNPYCHDGNTTADSLTSDVISMYPIGNSVQKFITSQTQGNTATIAM